MISDPSVLQAEIEYRSILGADKDIRILDIGFGSGWFIAAAVKLGYSNIEGADFGGHLRQPMLDWSSSIRAVHDIPTDLGTFLADREAKYDFIHLSHVIEHIPKHSLLYNVDAIYRALRPGGTLLIRTPNMEGPASNSTLFVTLGHEYGFSGSNLESLLLICNFDNIRFIELPRPSPTVRQHFTRAVRRLAIGRNRLNLRMFGAWNVGGQYGEELVAVAQRLNRPPLFDPATR
jgi:2-polyprenyl-3-methyl-5-hydroxy-6-metoxy-1,4-benzoquinol methylase